MNAVAPGQSADNPFPVRAVAIRVAGWIDRLGTVWVEGQIAQLTMRPSSNTAFITLRDPAADMSLSLTCPRCSKTQQLGVGRSRCGGCGLRFLIDIEEEHCGKCGYALHKLESAVCPECGTPVFSESQESP